MRVSPLYLRTLLGAVVILSACAGAPPALIVIGEYDGLATSPAAVEGAPVSGAVTCDQAVELALRDPKLLALGQRDARYRAARAARTSPMGSAELRVRENVLAPADVRATLRWRPPVPGERGLRTSAGEHDVARAKALDTLRKAELTAKVRRLHLSHREARLQMNARKNVVDALDASYGLDQAALAAGTMTSATVQQNALLLQRARTAVAQAREQVALAMTDFTVLVGRDAAESTCGTRIQKGRLAEHPAVVAAVSRARSLGESARADQAKAGFWPAFIEGSWTQDDDGETDGALIEVGIPLFSDAGRRADASRAEAARGVAEAQWSARRARNRVLRAEALVESLAARIQTAKANDPGDASQTPEVAMGSVRDRINLARFRAQERVDLALLEMALEAAKIELQAALGQP